MIVKLLIRPFENRIVTECLLHTEICHYSCSRIFHEAIFNILLLRKIARYFLIKVDHKCKHIVNKISLRIIKILTFFFRGWAGGRVFAIHGFFETFVLPDEYNTLQRKSCSMRFKIMLRCSGFHTYFLCVPYMLKFSSKSMNVTMNNKWLKIVKIAVSRYSG